MVIALPADSHLVYREKLTTEFSVARMEDPADLGKKYAAEVNVRLAKLIGTVKAGGFLGGRRVTCGATLSTAG